MSYVPDSTASNVQGTNCVLIAKNDNTVSLKSRGGTSANDTCTITATASAVGYQSQSFDYEITLQ